MGTVGGIRSTAGPAVQEKGMKFSRLLPLLGLLLLGACRPAANGPLYLGRGVPFVLRSPADGPPFFASQEVLFRLPDGKEEQLVTSVENDGDHLAVVASTPMGLTLFTLQLKQGVVTLDERVPLPKLFDPRLLPALIQLSNWPLEDLRKGLRPDATLDDEGDIRILRRKGKTVLTLRREGAAPPYRKTLLEIPSASISAVITTLED